jgi:hypothetical protein
VTLCNIWCHMRCVMMVLLFNQPQSCSITICLQSLMLTQSVPSYTAHMLGASSIRNLRTRYYVVTTDTFDILTNIEVL